MLGIEYHREMPYKYNRKNKRKAKKRSYRNTKFALSRTIVPDKHTVRLRYVQLVQLNPLAGVPASHVFRANSIHDPDFTGIGHQPLGHDQWVPFYNHYNVIGSKCTAKFISASTDDTLGAAHVGVLLKDDVTTIIDPVSIMEQGHNQYRIMVNSNAGSSSTRCSGFYSARKFMGIKDISDNRNLVGSSFGTNPSEGAFFHVYAAPVAAGLNADPLNVLVTIEYTVQLTERKSLDQS